MGGDGEGESVGFEVAGEGVLSVEKEVVRQGLDASLVGIPGCTGREIMRQKLEEIGELIAHGKEGIGDATSDANE